VLVLTGLGHRYGLIPELALLALISTGIVLAILAMAAGFYALVDIWKNGDQGAGSAVLAIFYAVPGVALFAGSVYALAVYPQLNDVSTDIVNPPGYLALTGQAPDPNSLPDEDQRQIQIAAYPDITARLYPVDIARVFEAVHGLVEQREWPIVGQTPPAAATQGAQPAQQQAVIQVVAQTLLFRFTDHVVIRMVPEAGGVRVDIRSASTFGRHDLGQNARRIRALLADLDLALQGERNDLQSANR
jgi:hypothetical protein